MLTSATWLTNLQYNQNHWFLLPMDRYHKRDFTRHYTWPGAIYNLH